MFDRKRRQFLGIYLLVVAACGLSGCATTIETPESLAEVRLVLERRGYRITEYGWGGGEDRVVGQRVVGVNGNGDTIFSTELIARHVEYVTEVRMLPGGRCEVRSQSRGGPELPLSGAYRRDEAEELSIASILTAQEILTTLSFNDIQETLLARGYLIEGHDTVTQGGVVEGGFTARKVVQSEYSTTLRSYGDGTCRIWSESRHGVNSLEGEWARDQEEEDRIIRMLEDADITGSRDSCDRAKAMLDAYGYRIWRWGGSRNDWDVPGTKRVTRDEFLVTVHFVASDDGQNRFDIYAQSRLHEPEGGESLRHLGSLVASGPFVRDFLEEEAIVSAIETREGGSDE
jgi:hypothetical protein